MHLAEQAMAIKRFSDKHGVGYGLRDSYDVAGIIRTEGLTNLLDPELIGELQVAFLRDREAELKEEGLVSIALV